MGRFVRKPWGWYLVLINRRYFKLKILKFKKDESCSMQKHEWRNELWLFLKGRGYFSELDKPEFAVRAGDFVQVPIGRWHRFEAMSNVRVLEVQYGSKCDEKDIERA